MNSLSDKISILYPGGAHGNFLKMILNAMLGNTVVLVNDSSVYDHAKLSSESLFVINHHWMNIHTPIVEIKHHLMDPDTPIINIRVNDTSLLKYCAVCFNRTSSLNLVLEDLNRDTIKKLKSHPIFSHFIPSLIELSGLDLDNDVPYNYLREWARLCFFDNDCTTIKQWMMSSIAPEPDIVLDFECFYNGTLKSECLRILKHFDLTPITTDIDDLIKHFEKNNRYRLIDYQSECIINSITTHKNINIESGNFLLEAWIDNWLKKYFKIDPLLQNSYFPNTQSLISQYNL